MVNLSKLICIYLPNGNPINTDKYPYKLKWLSNFFNFVKKEITTNMMEL